MESYYENYFSYDSSADYHISVYPQLDTKHNFPVGDGYDDYYNYVVWAQADPVYQPYYWNFFGPGPETEIDLSSIVLGGVFAYFTQGAQSGPPHHLRVNSDSDFTLSPSTNPPGCLCAQHSGDVGPLPVKLFHVTELRQCAAFMAVVSRDTQDSVNSALILRDTKEFL